MTGETTNLIILNYNLALYKLSNNKKVNHYKLMQRINLQDMSNDNYQEANLRPTIRVVLKIVDDCECSEEIKSTTHYYPGDHLAVYPENSHSLVNGIIERLSALNSAIEPNRPYLIKVKSSTDNQMDTTTNNNIINQVMGNQRSTNSEQKWIPHERFPFYVTLREALTRYLDITNPPTQRILSILSEHATNQSEAERLKHLSKNSESYENWKAKNFSNFLEVLLII